MVDLRTAKQGDILLSQHGAILRYLEPLSEHDYYDHKVEYLYANGEINKGKLGNGTRTNDGFVSRKNRLESDHNIVQIIPLEDWKKIKKLK